MWVPFYLGKQSTRWTTMWLLRHFVCWQITPAKVKVHRGRSFVQQTYFIPKCKQRRCGWGGDRVLFLRGTKIRWQVTQLLSLWIYFHFRSFPIFPWVSEIQTGYICQPDLTLMHCNKEAVSLNWKMGIRLAKLSSCLGLWWGNQSMMDHLAMNWTDLVILVISYCSNVNCDWKLHNNCLESVISGWGKAGSLISHIYTSRLRGGWSTRDSLLSSKAAGTDCSHLDVCFYKFLSLIQHQKTNLETPDGQKR